MPWKVYDVRRVIRPRADDPAKAASASRSIRAIASGSRDQMTAILRDLAHTADAETGNGDGIERAWLRHRGTTLPAAEHFLVAAPAGPEDKEGPGFQAAWQTATTTPAARRPGPDIQLPLPLTWATAA